MLVFTAFFSLLFADKFIFSPSVLISFSVFICLPSAFFVATNINGEKSLKKAVKHENKGIGIKDIIPLAAVNGFIGGVATVLSYRISMQNVNSIQTASCAALITFYIMGFLSAYLIEDGVLPTAKLIFSKLTFICLPICITVVTLFCRLPYMNALADIALPGFETVISAVILGIMPPLLMLAIKYLKKLFIDNSIK